jgi:predicted dehydrogenase
LASSSLPARPKILIVGLGSIGQRHARNLRTILGGSLDLIAYRVRGRNHVIRKSVAASGDTPESVYGIRRHSSLDDAMAERPDAVIVANPSSDHLGVARAAVEANCHLFVEKPLADRWDGVEDLVQRAERKGLITMVGYHFRFHPALQLVHRLLTEETIGRPVAARFVMGEYLPGWHPYEDFRESYAARRSLGGGVLLTQIHELDAAFWMWGAPARVFAAGGTLSSLEIDVEDVASVLLEYPRSRGSFPVHIQLDYLQRPPVRGGEIVGDRGRLTFDLLAGSVVVTAPDGSVAVHDAAIDRNDLYVAEMRHFLACLAGRDAPVVPLRAGAITLAMALAARESLETGAPALLPQTTAALGW